MATEPAPGQTDPFDAAEEMLALTKRDHRRVAVLTFALAALAIMVGALTYLVWDEAAGRTDRNRTLIAEANRRAGVARGRADRAAVRVQRTEIRGRQIIRYLQGGPGIPGVPGKGGIKGAPGPPGGIGQPGRPGASIRGEPGAKGEKGDSIVGEAGVKGDTGGDGKDGVDGQDGVNGTNGVDGKDGADGKDGENATDAQVQQAVDNYCNSHNQCAPGP